MTDPDGRLMLLDVNVLVALALANHVHHRPAHRALSTMTRWATTPLTEAALLRLLMNPLVAGLPLSAAQVSATLVAMREHAAWEFLSDNTSLADPQVDLTVLVGHQQVTDVHLVNLAASHDAVLGTFDSGLVAGLAPVDRRHVVVLAT